MPGKRVTVTMTLEQARVVEDAAYERALELRETLDEWTGMVRRRQGVQIRQLEGGAAKLRDALLAARSDSSGGSDAT